MDSERVEMLDDDLLLYENIIQLINKIVIN